MTEPVVHPKRKLPFDILDSIRGIASLYVAIAHCRGTLWVGGSEFMRMFPRNTWNAWDYIVFGSSMLTRLAVEFVIVFFVLSGFSIAHSLSQNKSPLQFYKRRFIRIYPSYFVAFFWAGAVFLITRSWHPEWYNGETINTAIQSGLDRGHIALVRAQEMNGYFNGSTAIKSLLYVPDLTLTTKEAFAQPQGHFSVPFAAPGHGFITPFWSLTYEIIFYLLAPFLLRKINWYAGISLVLFLINFIFPESVWKLNIPLYIYGFLFVFNIYFALGVLVYKYLGRMEGFFDKLSKFTLLAFIALLVLTMYAMNFYFKTESVFSFLPSALLGVLLIGYFLKYQVRIKWLMGIGRFSYTLYITHLASVFLYLGIYWLIVQPKVSYILNYFVWIPAVFFALGIAYLQYWLVEKRTKSILNMLRKKNVKPRKELSVQ
jgi:peptidoglycan/LPS O-acetylase OafA/YrhL